MKKPSLAISSTIDKLYLITAGVILIGFFLTIISYLRLCSEACAQGHNYHLFGMSFEFFGLSFFGFLGLIHFYSKDLPYLAFVELLLFCCAVGAEALFIIVQKYEIGSWCPVCLSIASIVLVGAIVQGIACMKQNLYLTGSDNQRNHMKTFWNKFSPFAAIGLGFIIAFFGVAKHDELVAVQEAIKDKLAFGNHTSNVEIYLFTDWACPACRKLEPTLEAFVPDLIKNHKVLFVDQVIHPETLNYMPFHLSFMVNNKPQYLKLRQMLQDLSKETGTPTEEQISKGSAKLGVTFQELNYADVAMGIKYFKGLDDKFKIKSTPTMVIINKDTKKGKKLVGTDEITKINVLKAIKTLTNS